MVIKVEPGQVASGPIAGIPLTRNGIPSQTLEVQADAIQRTGPPTTLHGVSCGTSPAELYFFLINLDGYYFIDLDEHKTAHLQKLCEGKSDVHIYTGDSNWYLTKELLPKIQYRKFNRALCLLDPYGLHLDWQVMLQAGQSRAVDLFLNFPVMDMNRNAIWRDPDKAPAGGIDRLLLPPAGAVAAHFRRPGGRPGHGPDVHPGQPGDHAAAGVRARRAGPRA